MNGLRPALLPGFSGVIEVTGTLDARGLAHEKPVSGRVLTLRASLATRYELSFEDDSGRSCRLIGERRPRLSDPLYSSSTVRADILDAGGRSLAELVLRFDYRRELWRFLPL